MQDTITINIKRLQGLIQQFETTFERKQGAVKLLAVSKGQSVAAIQRAQAAGLTAFGENYLQEALNKIEALSFFNLEWHFIGHIQANKTRKIAEHFHWVQSIACQKVAQRLNDQRPDSLLPLNVCIEVNMDREPQKSGIGVDEVRTLADFIQELPRLRLRGLMTLPTRRDTLEEQRMAFHKLRILYRRLKKEGYVLDTLSMGTTADFEAAIAEGSTLVRVGTAIFGPRE